MGWRVAVAVVLLLGTLAAGQVCRLAVDEYCSAMETLVAQVRNDPDDRAPLEEALGRWEARLPFLSSLINHAILEQVGLALTRANNCLLSMMLLIFTRLKQQSLRHLTRWQKVATSIRNSEACAENILAQLDLWNGFQKI